MKFDLTKHAASPQ